MTLGETTPIENESIGQPLNDFVVVLSSRAAFYLGRNEQLTIPDFPSVVGAVTLRFRTLRVVPAGFRNPVRLGLEVEARGQAPSLAQAVETFGNVARGLAAVLSVATNAPVDEPTAEIAYDDTPGKDQRKYWRRYTEPMPPSAHPGRRLRPQATIGLVGAFLGHPDRERLLRGITQYHHALQNFEPGLEIPALAHLWVGMEALTPIVVRRELASLGVSEDDLKQQWSEELTRLRKQPVELRSLNAEARRRFLFRGDDATYKAAKDASEGYEHAFSALWEVRDRALSTVVPTANYLRSAILDLAGLEPHDRDALLGQPFVTPLHWGLERTLEGYLVGDAAKPTASEDEYPAIEWLSHLTELPADEEGDAGVGYVDRIRAALPEGWSFRPAHVDIGAARPDQQPGTGAEGVAGSIPLGPPREIAWDEAKGDERRQRLRIEFTDDSEGEAQEGFAMVEGQWEYRTETVEAWPEDAEEASALGLADSALSTIGSEGWELAAVIPITAYTPEGRGGGTGWLHYVFKRRVPDPEAPADY